MGARADTRTYSKREFAHSVNYCALLACPSYVGTQLFLEALRMGYWEQLFSNFVLWTLAGLPFSFLISWVFIAPSLHPTMSRHISFARAAYWGCGIGVVLTVISVSLGRHQDFKTSKNPNFGYTIGGVVSERSMDGILTPYGWWVLAQNSIMFIVTRVFTSLTNRWIIGPGNAKTTFEFQ